MPRPKNLDDDGLRFEARLKYREPDIEIDEDAEIFESDRGAWVQAWVWVEFPEGEV